MTRTNYLLNAGPEGTAITQANSGVASVFNTSGGTSVYAAADANNLAFGAKFSANNGQAIARLALPNVSLVQTFTGVLTTPDVTQTANDFNLLTFNTGGSGTIARLQWKQTGALVLGDTAGAHSIVIAAPGVLTNNTKYRVTVRLSGNATAGAASATVNVYAANGTTVLATGTSAVLNMASTVANADLGNQGGVATQQSFGWAEVGVDSDNTAELAAYVPGANQPPTVTASSTASTTTPGTSVPLTAVAADSDGTIASLAWVFTSVPTGVTAPTINNASTANASFTPTTAGLYVAQVTVTDNAGATALSSVTIYVGGLTAQVIGVTSNPGAWTRNPSTSSVVAVLSDTDSTTYIESPGSPSSPATERLRLGPLQSPPTSFNLTLGTASLNGTGNLAFSATLYEGTTARKTWSGLTPSGADIVLSLSTAEIATVGSWNTLDIEVSVVAA